MNEQTEEKGKKKEADGEDMDPVHVIRKGAIAARGRAWWGRAWGHPQTTFWTIAWNLI